MKLKPFFLFTALLMLTAVACNLSGNQPTPAENTRNADLDATIVALQNQVQTLSQQNPSGDANEENSPVSSPTPNLPTSPVPAGVPIEYDGWSMAVSKELNINEYDNIWGIDIYVHNLTNSSRIFRFTNSSITATDNLGNTYQPSPICPYVGCSTCEEYYYQVKNLEVEANEEKTISSGTTGNGCMNDNGNNLFIGPIPVNVNSLIIHFEEFGPFSGVDVTIDL